MKIVGKLTSRGALAVILVGVLLTFVFLLYAVSRDAEIIWSKDGVVKIIPQGSEHIKKLEKLLLNSVSKDEYQRLEAHYSLLENEYRIACSRVNRLLAAAGVDLSKGEDVAIRKIEMLATRSKVADRDMNVSLAIIRLEVMRGQTINTNSKAMDDMKLGVYMDLQKFLRCIGVYNGKIDGNQAATCDAVKQFQKKYRLNVDGIIGQRTLAAMEKAFKQAKSH